MSLRASIATAGRVLQQLRRDPRTIALVIVVPVVLMTLLKYILEGQEETFNRVGGPLIGIFPFITMFLVTSITMLRERTTGTLERLMTLPLAKLDLLVGYGLAFAALAIAQAVVVTAVALGPLDLEVTGSALLVGVLAVANAILGMALGLFVSAFARSEFQAVQFMPAFVLPQLLLCGLFAPREEMAAVLEGLSWALPLTYAYNALERVSLDGALDGGGVLDLTVIVAATALSLVLAAATLRRRTA